LISDFLFIDIRNDYNEIRGDASLTACCCLHDELGSIRHVVHQNVRRHSFPGPFKLAGLPNAPETVAGDRYGNHRQDENSLKRRGKPFGGSVILKNREE
jgi:hypothetical protein